MWTLLFTTVDMVGLVVVVYLKYISNLSFEYDIFHRTYKCLNQIIQFGFVFMY